jgi:hypothetical protein
MGHWVMHLEGSGIHDNGNPADADAMFREFVNQLAIAGQSCRVATFTTGSTRELSDANQKQTGRIESPSHYQAPGFAERLAGIRGRKPLHDAIERGPADGGAADGAP